MADPDGIKINNTSVVSVSPVLVDDDSNRMDPSSTTLEYNQPATELSVINDDEEEEEEEADTELALIDGKDDRELCSETTSLEGPSDSTYSNTPDLVEVSEPCGLPAISDVQSDGSTAASDLSSSCPSLMSTENQICIESNKVEDEDFKSEECSAAIDLPSRGESDAESGSTGSGNSTDDADVVCEFSSALDAANAITTPAVTNISTPDTEEDDSDDMQRKSRVEITESTQAYQLEDQSEDALKDADLADPPLIATRESNRNLEQLEDLEGEMETKTRDNNDESDQSEDQCEDALGETDLADPPLIETFESNRALEQLKDLEGEMETRTREDEDESDQPLDLEEVVAETQASQEARDPPAEQEASSESCLATEETVSPDDPSGEHAEYIDCHLSTQEASYDAEENAGTVNPTEGTKLEAEEIVTTEASEVDEHEPEVGMDRHLSISTASHATENLLRHATFKPIANNESDASNHEDSRSLNTAQDLPQLEDISVATSQDSRLSTVHVPETTSATPGADRGREPAEDVPPPETSSASVASTASFKQQHEPDGDCEFLNQTLNISAIDTSALLSESCLAKGPASERIPVEEPAQESMEKLCGDEDAPGDVMTDESKIITEQSMIVVKASQPVGATEVQPILKSDDLQLSCESSDENRDEESPTDKPLTDVSAASLSSFVSAEQSREGIELVQGASNDGAVVDTQSSCPAKFSSDLKSTKSDASSSPIPGMMQFTKAFSESTIPERQGLAPRRSSPATLLSLNGNQTERHGDNGMRNTRDGATDENSSFDPDGALLGKQQDLTLMGGLKKSSSRVEVKPRPRVSFAAMHKGPHYETSYEHPGQLEDDESQVEDEHCSKLDQARRARFAAYLRRRMIDFDEEEDDESFAPKRKEDGSQQRCHDGIPRILDPGVMCTSVESSFTTLVSKPEAVDDSASVYSAIDAFVDRNRGRYDDSDSDSSYCTDSDDSYEDDEDAKSSGFFPSLFSEADSSSRAISDQIPQWCREVGLPSVLQLEDVLKVATDFGRTNRKKKVTLRPHNSDQEALSEFVNELENEEPMLNNLGNCEEDKESSLAIVSKPKVPPAKQQASRDDDMEKSLSSEVHHECGVLTFQDIHELALMAAAAIETTTANRDVKQPRVLKRNHTDPNLSMESTEAAWDHIEHTVTDHESVTGQSFQEKSKAHDRVAAKLEHIKKTQPQVYKVFLAKMAAAERSGRKFELRRDDVILNGSPVKKGNAPIASPSSKAHALGSNEGSTEADEISVQTPTMSVKIQVNTAEGRGGCNSTAPSDWESFDGSPFNEPVMQSFLSRDATSTTDQPDDSSIFDDMKWLSSAKDRFNSTMESFMGGPKKRPLQAKLAQYSKSHPSVYRILLEKINEREKQSHNSCPQNDEVPINSSQEVTEKEFMVEQERGRVDVCAQDNDDQVQTGKSPDVVRTPKDSRIAPIRKPKEPVKNSTPRRKSWTANGRINSNSTHHAKTKHIESQYESNFMKRESKLQPRDSNEDICIASSSKVAKKVSLFNGLEQSDRQKQPLVCGKPSSEKPDTRSDVVGLALNNRVDISGRRSFAHRSKTPLSSNRTGGEELPTRSELTKTPRSSNRSEVKHIRPTMNHDLTNVKTNQPETKMDAKADAQRKVSHARASSVGCQPRVPTSNLSQWESFEGSSFKDFVDSLSGPTSSEDKQRKSKEPDPGIAAKAAAPQIDLQTTFLDSILPAPPTFPAQSESHGQQRNPWDFSEAAEAAEEHWEHFSPLSFDGNFTKWGRPKFHTRTKASPSSAAEF